tara:strand:- start:838 stop:1173 length:336 start_codon:yes stop_codon:yes gene_type:complete
MKNFKLVALAFVIGTSSLFAFDAEGLDLSKNKIRNQIEKLLTVANIAVEKEMTVDLTFTFSSNGEIVVLNVNSRDPEVLEFIRKNLNYHKIENPGERDKIYSMPLNLKVGW